MPILLVPADYPVSESADADGVKETSIAILLPHSFGPGDLELPRQSAS